MNIRPETPRRKHRRKLHDIGFGSDFMNMTLKKKSRKVEINKTDYIKFKSLCITKEIINKVKWEETFIKHISNEGLMSKIYKELIQWNNKRSN